MSDQGEQRPGGRLTRPDVKELKLLVSQAELLSPVSRTCHCVGRATRSTYFVERIQDTTVPRGLLTEQPRMPHLLVPLPVET